MTRCIYMAVLSYVKVKKSKGVLRQAKVAQGVPDYLDVSALQGW